MGSSARHSRPTSRSWKSRQGWSTVPCNHCLSWTADRSKRTRGEGLNSIESLRVAAYWSLDPEIKPLYPSHNCCSCCTAVCNCGGTCCEASVLPFEGDTSTIPETTGGQTRNVTARDRQDLKCALRDVFTK